MYYHLLNEKNNIIFLIIELTTQVHEARENLEVHVPRQVLCKDNIHKQNQIGCIKM